MVLGAASGDLGSHYRRDCSRRIFKVTTMAAKKQEATGQRFSEAESARYSAIQTLACKYLCDKPGADWIECVGRATREIDVKKTRIIPS